LNLGIGRENIGNPGRAQKKVFEGVGRMDRRHQAIAENSVHSPIRRSMMGRTY